MAADDYYHSLIKGDGVKIFTVAHFPLLNASQICLIKIYLFKFSVKTQLNVHLLPRQHKDPSRNGKLMQLLN